MQPPLDWLLTGPAWIQYRARLDLLHQPADDPRVVQSRRETLLDPQVQSVILGLADWPGEVLSSHKSAGQAYHRLNFLADLGLRAGDHPLLAEVAERILAHPSEQGPFGLPMSISTAHGGDGQTRWAWALCDAPLQIYALIRLGLGDHPSVQKALDFLLGLARENGWPCAVSPELNFRGPGRKSDPCPYANLVMLKVLGQVQELRDSRPAQIGIQTLLSLWENRRDEHPYIFYMGTDFCKLKAPLVWYDLLHALDVLGRFPVARNDPRFHEMLATAAQKADDQGRFTAESVWMQWKEWEFGQKKQPSRWITLLIHRIINL